MSQLAPFSRPLYVMPKPAGSACNLVCDYCYYLEKRHLTGGRPQMMSDATLESFVRQYIEAQTQDEVLFTWHGGEPLLRPLAFYERAMELQRRYGRGRHIANCLQTNGTLLTPEWCRFLSHNGWLVGVSIDGPPALHDAYRHVGGGATAGHDASGTRPPGSHGSAAKVVAGIRLLQRHGVEWNVMGVVNALNADHPLEVYAFYKELGASFIQFTPIVERLHDHADGRHLAEPICSMPATTSGNGAASPLAPFSVTPSQYARFLVAVFDEWVLHDVGNVYVQLFDSTLAAWVGEPPGICTMAPTCGHALAVEADGDLYSCDHFVFPAYRLGNILDTPLATMAYGARQQAFGRAKRDGLAAACRRCRWLFACGGGCPKDRLAGGLNYLCPAYRAFFEHVAPAMDFMANELRHERPPANVMAWAACNMGHASACLPKES